MSKLRNSVATNNPQGLLSPVISRFLQRVVFQSAGSCASGGFFVMIVRRNNHERK